MKDSIGEQRGREAGIAHHQEVRLLNIALHNKQRYARV